MRIGVINAGVVLFFIRIVVRAMLGVADLPKIVLVFISFLVGGQGEEFLALIVGNDVNDVLIDPALVLCRELGLFGGGGKVQSAKKRGPTAKAVRSIFLFSTILQKKRRSKTSLSGP